MIQDPVLRQAAQLSLLLHKRPSELLGLEGSEVWRLEVDYRLVTAELERCLSESEENSEEKAEKIREWKKCQK